MDRPIPAAYYVYGLRSRTGFGRPYVGSTPHPPRRLAQHNGLITGGASKTARSGRPWDMMFVVAGFTSKIAALQFEWALGNYHLTNFIPTEARLVHPVRVWRTKNGRRYSKLEMPRGQKAENLFENLHLLLRVDGFYRWPLTVQFLRRDSFAEWREVTKNIDPPLPPERPVFLSPACEADQPTDDGASTEGVHKPQGKLKSDRIPLPVRSLNLTYDAMKPQVRKSMARLQSGARLQCQICRNNIDTSNNHSLFCPLDDCDMVGHLTCLSSHFFSTQGHEDELVPTTGQCPKCHENIPWCDMVRDLSLRLRGPKDVANILKDPKHKNKTATGPVDAVGPEVNDDSGFLKNMQDEDGGEDDALNEGLDANSDDSDFEDIDAVSNQSDEIHKLPPLKRDSPTRIGRAPIFTKAKIIPDSDWDDIEQISD